MIWTHILCAAILPAALASADCPWKDVSGPLAEKAAQACGSKDAAGWQGPESCTGGSCLYWNARYNDGQGVALLTSAEHAIEAATTPQATALDGSAPLTAPGDPPFRVAEVPGKGRGLVATRLIPKGEVIMATRLMLAVEAEGYLKLPKDQANDLLRSALDKLSPAARDSFMSQAGDDPHTKLLHNSFRVWIGPEGKHMGAYPQAALINHDCRPSTTYRLDNLTHVTTAVRDIRPGEELTNSYIKLLVPRAERLARLREWGFDCTCAQCSLPDDAAAASDANLARIKALTDALDAGPGGGAAAVVVTADMGRELVELHERERLDLYLGPACTRAALNYGMFGMRDEAVAYARRAVEGLTRQYGPRAHDIASLSALAEDPEGHWTWGLRKKKAAAGEGGARRPGERPKTMPVEGPWKDEL